MEIKYCEKWSLFYKETRKNISQAEAHKRHIQRESYTAVIIENDMEKYIINLVGKWVSVYFLDEHKRNYLYYSFKEIEENRLFLNEASYWEYDGDNEKILSTIHFTFFKDGNTIMSQKNEITGEVLKKESKFSVEKNLDVYPGFAKYNSLFREERE